MSCSSLQKRVKSVFFSILTCLALITPAMAAPPKVVASLLSDATELVPGKPVTVAVRLKLAPKYHVYWANPGDSGSATTVKWKLPEGITAGALQFPSPHRISIPGGMVNFGYENEVIHLATLNVSENVRGRVELAADVNWLVCDDDSCTPGNAKNITLKLPVDSNADATLIENVRKQLPVPADQCADVKQVKPTADSIEIEWKSVPKDIQFFPPADKFWTVEEASVTTEGTTTRIKYRLVSQHPKGIQPSTDKPVVGYTIADGARRAIELPATPKPSNP